MDLNISSVPPSIESAAVEIQWVTTGQLIAEFCCRRDFHFITQE